MRDPILGNNGDESPDENSAFDWRNVFEGVNVAAVVSPQAGAVGDLGVPKNEEIDFDSNWTSSTVEVKNESYSGEKMLDVNLNLGLSGEASSSTVLKEDSDPFTCSKRPKVNSFSL